MAFKKKNPDSNCVSVTFKLCSEALDRVKDYQAEMYRKTGRVPSKGQVINYIIQGKDAKTL